MSTLRTPVALAACVATLFGATTALADDEESATPPITTMPSQADPQAVEPVQPAPQEPPASTTTTTAAPYGPPYYYPPSARAPRYTEQIVERRPNSGLLSTGTSLFLISYGSSVVAGAVSSREEDKRLFIPVAGPWMDLAQRDCRERECGPNEEINKALIMTSGIVQGMSALMVLASLFIPETVTVEERSAKVKVLPVSFGAGVGVGATGRF